jgi:energy-converting hydrogenase Eha subunit G
MRESEASNNKLRACISVRASGPRVVSRWIGLEYNAIVSLTLWLIGMRFFWSASNKNCCCIIFFGSGPVLKPATTANQARAVKRRGAAKRNKCTGYPAVIHGCNGKHPKTCSVSL